MAESLGKAVLELAADSLGLDKELDSAEKKADTSSKSIGSKFKSGLKSAMLPAVAILATAGAAAKETIDAASDLNEQINKTGTVFGKSAKGIQAWSKTTASSLGISQRAALEAAGTFGNMLVPMGFTKGKAAEMSKSLVGLAADMASFNNASPEETLDALRSGLSGETEPLRKFGVFLNASRVQAEAMSLGLVKATKDTDKIKAAQLRAEVAQRNYTKAVKEHGASSDEAKRSKAGLIGAENALKKAVKGNVGQLTAAQKAQATYSLITKDTASAQGDFAKTSTSAANAERIQAAKTEDLKAKLGQGLLPAYQALLQIGLKVTAWAADHTEAVKKVVGVILALAAAVVAINVGMKLYAAGAAVVTAAQWAWNTALLGFPLVWVVAAIAAVIAIIVLAVKHWDDIKRITLEVWDAIKAATVSAWGAIKDFFAKWWPFIFAVFTGGLSLIVGLIIRHWDDIKSATSNAWNAVKGVIGAVFGAIVTAVSTALGAVKSTVTNGWNAVKSATSSAWGAVKGVVDGAVDGVKGSVTAAWSAVKTSTSSAWSAVKSTVSGGVGDVVGFVRGLPSRAVEALSSLGSRLAGAGKSGMGDFKDAVGERADSAVALVKGLPGRLAGALGHLGGLLVNEGKAIVQGLINGIESILPALWGKVSGIAKKIKSLKGPIEKDRVLLVDEGKAIIQGLGYGIDREFSGLKKDIAGYAPTIQSTFAASAAQGPPPGPSGSTIDKLVNIEHMEVHDAFDEAKVASDIAWKVVSG